MTAKALYQIIGDMDDALIIGADAPQKRRFPVIPAAAACICLLVAAAFFSRPAEPPRNIVAEFGYVTPMAMEIADINNLEAITELSTQIVLCRVERMTDVMLTETGMFSFRYEVEILDLLLNVSDRLNIGDRVKVSSTEGIMKALDAAALVSDSQWAKKRGVLQGEYTEGDYILSSTWNAIPIEAGSCYVMFLTDEYLESEGVYSECGRSFLYQYDGQKVYSGRASDRYDSSLNDLLEQIRGQISRRTGRVQEIGKAAYLNELAERQNNEQTAQ